MGIVLNEVILIRTDHYDEALDALVRRLQADTSRPVFIMSDSQKKGIQYPADLTVVPVVPATLNLYSGPDVMWKCGDYTLYAALDALPQASTFWMIEPDVRIHSTDIKSFFDGSEISRLADFVTAWHTAASPQWTWYQTMSPFSKNIFNCMLQLCRLSRPAIKYLFERRVALSKRFIMENRNAVGWPNDEAFVAATLLEGGFETATFQDHAPGFVTERTFSFTKPTSLKWLAQQSSNNRIYHPVVQGPKYLHRICDYLNERKKSSTPEDLMKEFGTSTLEQIRVESGEVDALNFYDKVKVSVRGKMR